MSSRNQNKEFIEGIFFRVTL